MRFRGSRTLAAAVVGLAAVLLAPAARAADPFYENLMRKGQDEYNRREFEQAARSLRLACFGFLEEPKLLAVGLTRLALTQAAAGDDGFGETFRRLAEVEERFQAWSEADMPPGLRDDLRRLVLSRVPPATLAATPFASFLPSPDEQVAAIPAERRRAELERRIREHPGQAVWRVLLGELELARGEPGRAADRASEALAREPGNDRALRLRGLASAELERWDRAVDDLAAAGADPADAVVGPVLLRAYVKLGRWQDAAAVAAALPAEVRGRRDVAALLAEVKKVVSGMTEKEHRPPVPEDDAGPAPGGDDAAAVSDADRAALETGRTLLSEGRTRAALDAVEPVAEQHPDWLEAQRLAGELEYRLGRWAAAAGFLGRAAVGDDRPDLLFYQAVSLFETGRLEEAGDVLRRCLPRIRRTAFVDDYARRILSD